MTAEPFLKDGESDLLNPSLDQVCFLYDGAEVVHLKSVGSGTSDSMTKLYSHS
jgi:hypothetical protein